MRTIVIGDIHGCVDEFRHLLQDTEYKRGRDRLLLLGDLIDRGPDPAGVVRLAREVGAESLMGNHEEKALRWRRHEAKRKAHPEVYKNPMQPQNEARLAEWAKIPDEDWDWISNLPLFSRILSQASWVAVHGGCMPNVPIEQQKHNELLRMRYINPWKMKMTSPDERGEKPEGCQHWTELWKGPENIVYGHFTYDETFITEPNDSTPVWTLGIDTACVHGQFLTAAIFFQNLPGFEIWQVAAKQVYAERKAWNAED